MSSQYAAMLLAALSAGAAAWLALSHLIERHRVRKRVDSILRNSRPAPPQPAPSASLLRRKRPLEKVLKILEAEQAEIEGQPGRTLASRLRRAGLNMRPAAFRTLLLGFGLLASLGTMILTGSPALALMAGLGGGAAVPFWFVRYLTRRRQRRFLDAFAPAIEMIIRGAKAGLHLNACLELAATEADEPVRSAFAILLVRYQVGIPLAESFRLMYRDMPLQEVHFFAVVIALQERSGGNLSHALTNLSQVLQDRQRIAAKVRIYSAESRLSAAVIGSMPVIVAGLVWLTSPQYFAGLWQEPSGQRLATLAAIWMVLGCLVLWRMIRFEY